jgi:hypothetical protein
MSLVQLGDMAKEIDRLRAELEAERAKGADDARRLDWMEAHRVRVERLIYPKPWRVETIGDPLVSHYGDTLRDAVDAGRKATGGGE